MKLESLFQMYRSYRVTELHTLDDVHIFSQNSSTIDTFGGQIFSVLKCQFSQCVNMHFVVISYPHKFYHWFQSNYYNGS